ncbi:MAG: lysophospholipid acyltransferase family protein [Candidatus Kerfeldbacteria bacterium]
MLHSMEYRIWRKIVLPLFGSRTTVEGIERVPVSGAFIVAANHQSYTDGVQVTLSLLQHRDRKAWYLTTEHVWRSFGSFGGSRLLRWLGMIPIMSSRKADALGPAIEMLNNGGVIGIFPEGGRNKPSVNPAWETEMLRGKTGIARLALATGVPVIPAGIIAPKGFSAWQAIVNFLRRKQEAIVRFGKPMIFAKEDLTTVTKERLVEVTNAVMREIARLCGKAYPY